MKTTGEKRVRASRETVWRMLEDPAVLKRCIPNCEHVERTGPDAYSARIALKLGILNLRFQGGVRLEDKRFPEACRIVGRGEGGLAGFAAGSALVRLSAEHQITVLAYTVDSEVGGRVAQFGARLVEARVDRFVDTFFSRLARFAASERETPAA